MARLDRFWNYRIEGIPAFLFLMICRIFEKLLDRLTSYCVCKNLCSVGNNVAILHGFKYRYPNNIILGDNVTIGSNVIFSSELATGKIVVKDNVVIGRNCKIDFSGSVVIEEGVLLSEGVVIQTHDHGLDPRSEPIGKSLLIKKGAWLGIYSTVLSNTKVIGSNSILAANSVATKELDNGAIYAGIPAVKIKNV